MRAELDDALALVEQLQRTCCAAERERDAAVRAKAEAERMAEAVEASAEDRAEVFRLELASLRAATTVISADGATLAGLRAEVAASAEALAARSREAEVARRDARRLELLLEEARAELAVAQAGDNSDTEDRE